MRINRAVPMVSLVAIAMFGCNEASLFESTTSSKVTDAGGSPDAPVSSPDAMAVLTCPTPCVGDAVAEFGMAPWSYLGEGPQASGVEYLAMSADGANSWTAGTDGAIITRCDSATGPCAGVEDYLLMIPGTSGSVPVAPALAFKAPESATYRVSGVVRVPDGSTLDLADRFLLSRNGKHDAVVLTTLRTSTTDMAIDGTFTALAGDEIILSIAGSAGMPIAFRLFYSRVDTGDSAFPGDCQIAVTFSSGDSLGTDCGNASVQNLMDHGDAGVSVAGPGPSEGLGEGRVFDVGQFLKLGNSPMNYDGDFTVQFYYKATLPVHFSGPTVFADWNNAVPGGINLFLADTARAGACYQAHGGITETEGLCVVGNQVADANWHFLRLVRSVANNSFSLCQDGSEVLSLALPGDALLSSDEPPHIARNVTYNPAYYSGSIDDVRIFSSALPCSTAP